MRHIVTRATGLIGSRLVKTLFDRGVEVVAWLRNPKQAANLPSSVETLASALSLFARESVEPPEVDTVIHVASIFAAPTRDDYDRINGAAVADLLRCLEAQSWAYSAASSLAPSQPQGRRT